MLTPNGGVFGRNPKFNNVTVDGNLTVNGDIALGDDITVADTLTVGGVTTITDATAATSTTTGALKVTGGISTQNAVHAASDSFVNGVRIGKGAFGSNNTLVGNGAGSAFISGSDRNTLIGVSAGNKITSAQRNVAVGYFALSNATTLGDSVAIGDQCMQNATGSSNVSIGFQSQFGSFGAGLHAGAQNVFIGTLSGINNTGSGNVGIGTAALARCHTNNTVGIGTSALSLTGNSRFNTAVGYQALLSTASRITAVSTVAAGTGGTDGAKTGIQLERVSGGYMGVYPTVDLTVTSGAVSGTVTVVTGGSATTTTANGGIVFKANAAGIAAGVPADWTCETAGTGIAEHNTGMGYSSLLLNYSGAGNSAFGSTALDACVSGSRNSAFGFDSLGAATGSDNTALGSDSGDGISTGSQNTCLGSNADTAAGGDSNSTVIGYNAVGDGSNTVVIGNSSVTSHKLHGTATSAAIISGDTLRIVTRKAPASNAAGTAGDICIGDDAGTTYLYFCIANNNWGRVAFTTGY